MTVDFSERETFARVLYGVFSFDQRELGHRLTGAPLVARSRFQRSKFSCTG
jgi:hypothetical protein